VQVGKKLQVPHLRSINDPLYERDPKIFPSPITPPERLREKGARKGEERERGE
jgi:hypothetical protein